MIKEVLVLAATRDEFEAFAARQAYDVIKRYVYAETRAEAARWHPDELVVVGRFWHKPGALGIFNAARYTARDTNKELTVRYVP